MQKLRVDGTAAFYELDRFVATHETLRDTLEKFGLAILPGLLDEREIQNMNAGMWTTLKEMTADFSGSFTPIDGQKAKTWANIDELKPMHGYLVQHSSIGHAKYVWDLRANAKVCEAFATVHETKAEELLTSYDAVGILLPDGKVGKTRTSPNLWLHTDQRFNYELDPFRYSVQAWITGFDVADGCATLAFLEGSHKFHAAFAERFEYSRHGFNFFQLQYDEEFKFLHDECGCPLRAVRCPAGSMVMFDSRLFHSGMAPPSGAQPVPRHVVYVCMTPRSWCSEKDVEKRRDLFFNKRMTAHTPHKPTAFPQNPRGHTLPIRPPSTYSAEEMTERMRTLVPLQ